MDGKGSSAREWAQRWGAYAISFVLVTAVVVYGLNLPTYLSGARELVHEYYYTNFVKSTILDFFLIAAYISAGRYTAYDLGWAKTPAGQIAGIMLASAIISGAFAAFFLAKPPTNNFFSKWFHAAGASAVLYDVILVSTVYWVAAAGKRQFEHIFAPSA